MRRSGGRRWLAASGLLLAWTAAGCSRSAAPPVPVAVPTASPAACAAFAGALPDSLGDGLSRRATTPRDPRLAAYGDPPVVVRCGAPYATAWKQGVPLVAVDGVEWFQEIGPDAVVWSTPRAFVNVEVTVPKAHPGHGGLLALLSPAVRSLQG